MLTPVGVGFYSLRIVGAWQYLGNVDEVSSPRSFLSGSQTIKLLTNIMHKTMKKIKHLLTLMAVSICAMVQMSAAERVQPINPTISVSEISSDTEVYLFNIGGGKHWGWMHYNPESSSYMIYPRQLNNNPCKFTISKTEEGYYHFKLVESDRSLCVYGSNWYVECNTRTDVCYDFLLADSANAVTIQMADSYAYYDASHYLGWVSGDDGFHRNLTGGNIFWLIVPATEQGITDAIYYKGRFDLYNALVASDGNGYCVDKYEEIYANENSTAEELIAAATELNNALDLSNYVRNAWGGEYPILFQEVEPNSWGRANNNLLRRYYSMSSGEQQTLEAIVDVDQEVALRYNPYNSNSQCDESDNYGSYDNNYYWQNYNSEYYVTMEVYVDDKLVRTINRQELGRDWYFYETLPKGKHTIKWVATCPEGYNSQYIDLQWVSLWRTPAVSVNLREAGSLGLEVLASTDSNGDKVNRIQDVRKLKIKGPMNADDWAQIDNMPSLFSLDLSEATVTVIPDNMFNRDTNNGGKNSKDYLHEIKLPSTLQRIGYRAFRCSYVDDIVFPATLTSIGDEAFHEAYLDKAILHEGVTSIGQHAFSYCFSLKEASVPESVTSFSNHVFRHCYDLEKASLPKGQTTIPDYCFNNCHNLKELPLHEGITAINRDAFTRCWAYNPTLPSTLRSLGDRSFFDSGITEVSLQKGVSVGFVAFKYCPIKNLVIPEEAALGNLCFADCKQLETVEFPSSFYTAGNESPILRYDNALKTVRLKCSSMVVGDYKDRFFWNCGSAFTVQVPDYLVNIYKQDNYWKDYTLEGFGTEEVNDWYVRNPLVLTYRDTWKGNPNVTIQYNTGTLHIKEGGDPININDLYVDWQSQLLCEREGVSIKGDYTHCYFAPDDVWYFISLPFNFKPKDVTTKSGAHVALRYYDGANRAVNGASGNWKDLPADTTVAAGSGFIMRTSKRDYVFFRALNDGDKQNIVSTAEFSKALQINDSEDAANKGWNLVGNPYQTYYNIHKMNTTAPITVYEHTTGRFYRRGTDSWGYWPNGGNYKAYSIVDDDYAMLPNGAFFLQCPDENAKVTFPTVGKQLTTEITDQNGVRAEFMQQPELRKLVDLRLFAGVVLNNTEDVVYDQTRVVFNPMSLIGYERSCDASKFANEDTTIPQLYSLGDDNVHYAINERPVEDGTVRLGIYAPTDGMYTFRVSRNRQAGSILLYDELENVTTDITDEGYTFHAKAGTTNNRFRLVAQSLVTDVTELPEREHVAMATEGGLQINGQALIYATDGRLVARTEGGFVPARQGVYIVRQGRKSVKVSVK